MSLDQGIKHGKEKREEYRGSKRFDRSCRNGGNCGYCQNNRRIGFLKMIEQEKIESAYFKNNEDLV